VNDDEVLAALGDVASELLDRHLDSAKEWFPHELIPRPPADGHDQALPDGVRSALTVNLLTEDNLPYYVLGLSRAFDSTEPWWTWVRRWTAEEMRHAIVLRDYLTMTGAVDLVALERLRMRHVSEATVPVVGGAPETLVYLSMQELATRIAHWNTGEHLDSAGRAVMHRVAADENLHHLFYRDIVSAGLELDASRFVRAIETQVRHFAMPGSGMPGFAEHSRAIAETGIFSATSLLEQVFVPCALRHWCIDRISKLTPEAQRSRDRTLAFLDRLARISVRLSGAVSAVGSGDDAAPGGSS
jgi:acyl-[acyl-carrier-protein] desaturase